MTTGFVRSMGIISVSIAAGCSSVTEPIPPPPEVPKFTCTSNSATMRLPAELVATLPAFGPRGAHDDYVSISRSVPGGFAGLFWDEDRWVLTFVDPQAATLARIRILQAFVGRSGIPSSVDVAKAEFRSAQWTFAELDEWYRYIFSTGAIFSHGALTAGIDVRANTIKLSVLDEDARSQVEARLASLGVSCNLVTTEIGGIPDLDG